LAAEQEQHRHRRLEHQGHQDQDLHRDLHRDLDLHPRFWGRLRQGHLLLTHQDRHLRQDQRQDQHLRHRL
jgi:hypothetical protein